MATVFYFRIDDPDYPRNQRVRAFLAARGHEVRAHQRSRRKAISGLLADVRALARGSEGADVILVSEMSLTHVPIAWVVSRIRGVPLVVDGFVGRYETKVLDWQAHAPGSVAARMLAAIDAVSVRLSDLYLLDTRLRADAIVRAHPKAAAFSLPVGAPEWAAAVDGPPSAAGPMRVLFYGAFLPLHGVPTIIEAASRCRVDLKLTVIGTAAHSGGVADMQTLAERRGIANRVRFVPAMPPAELAARIAEHHVVLGVFGQTEKASGVIANKVWQGLAAGRVVVTRQSPALAEIEGIAGRALVQVPPADPDALAGALDALALQRDGLVVPRIAPPLEAYVEQEFRRFAEAMEELIGRSRRARRTSPSRAAQRTSQ